MSAEVDSSRLRLESIKLVGFKSFVEPTTIKLPSNLTGIVGPNGCGKSNIIDAVRCMMGESSAKHLRGESMADVIFNGSTQRAPLGQASIELTFHNPDGALGGEYAHFEKICIRREVTRDGQSNYYLNNTRCRRRDIVDIFLGTGLGPRSYAIIGQGTISKIIEAKPEELRNYLEEAAGISEYKERRRETENRIRATRENLDRINDIREELQNQLDKLQRQAQAAERYQILKKEERQLEQELLALRWQHQAQKSEQIASQLTQAEILLESKNAELTQCIAQLETLREVQHSQTEETQQLQENFYLSGQKVSQLEQSIHHQQQRIDQCEQEIDSIKKALIECQTDLETSRQIVENVEIELGQLNPLINSISVQHNDLKSAFERSELEVTLSQREWEEFTTESHKTQQQAHVKQNQIQNLEQQIQTLRNRAQRTKEMQSKIEFEPLIQEISEYQAQQENLQATLEELTEAKKQQQQQIYDRRNDLDAKRRVLQQQQQLIQQKTGRLASLEALQQAALGHDQTDLDAWLDENQLTNNLRLGAILTVDSKWQLAVETVMGKYLQAICVDTIDNLPTLIPGGTAIDCIVWQTSNMNQQGQPNRLSHAVTGDANVIAMLDSVYQAENLTEALKLREKLAVHESIITPEGVWISSSWVRLHQQDSTSNGIFARESAIKEEKQNIAETKIEIEAIVTSIDLLQEQLLALEQQQEMLQQQWQSSNHRLADITAKTQVKQNHLQQLEQRQQQLHIELEEYNIETESLSEALLETRSEWQIAMQAMQKFADQREKLQSNKTKTQATYEQTKRMSQQINQQYHDLRVQHQRLTSELNAKQELATRADIQIQHYQQRFTELTSQIDKLQEPLAGWKSQLEAALDYRLTAEEDLQVSRQQLQNIEHQMRGHEKLRQTHDQSVQQQREANNQLQLEKQGFDVRRSSIEEQLAEYQVEVKSVIAELSDDANEVEWQTQLDRIKQRIQRLGAINLAAIDEFTSQSERKTYLDAQYEDLTQALETLENAIQKIDKETKQRFKETYDTVNNSFKTLFPKIFGGGSAMLEFTGEDLLETGITVMARPPGKKNTTIHLLSGGEKALTAIALVFAIFKLNPAPFCMLDEVDAPLDDQNVNRYCQLVKNISKEVQILFISHNKIAIEMAEQLIGVTMREPGVSRMVSVDIQAAVDMVEN